MMSTGGYVKSGNYFQIPGKVLHLDGDPAYLKKCMSLYEKIGIPVYGIHCNEKEMPEKIGNLLIITDRIFWLLPVMMPIQRRRER